MTTPPRTPTMREATQTLLNYACHAPNCDHPYQCVCGFEQADDDARAALAAEESGWLPIETAPNQYHDDGLFVTGPGADLGSACIWLNAEWPVFLRYDTRDPAKAWLMTLGVTHWRPALSPPSPSTKNDHSH